MTLLVGSCDPKWPIMCRVGIAAISSLKMNCLWIHDLTFSVSCCVFFKTWLFLFLVACFSTKFIRFFVSASSSSSMNRVYAQWSMVTWVNVGYKHWRLFWRTEVNENGSELQVEYSTCVQLLERRSTCRHWSEHKELGTFHHDPIFCCMTAEPEPELELSQTIWIIKVLVRVTQAGSRRAPVFWWKSTPKDSRSRLDMTSVPCSDTNDHHLCK